MEKIKKLCPNCEGYGYTIEVEAECCRKGENECCGIPDPVQVQKQCPYCDANGLVEIEETL